MATRVSFNPSGTCYPAPDGAYELPVESDLLHRFTLFQGQIIDLYDGVSDDEVRQRDATDPREPDEPEAPPQPSADEVEVTERLTVLEGTVDFLVEVALGGSGQGDADEPA